MENITELTRSIHELSARDCRWGYFYGAPYTCCQ